MLVGVEFFLGFATETIRPMPSMKEYLSFAAKLLLAFGVVFELPLVITFMAKLGLVTVPFLKRNRKYAVLLFFAGAAILTPPDVVTQIMMALPLMTSSSPLTSTVPSQRPMTVSYLNR